MTCADYGNGNNSKRTVPLRKWFVRTPEGVLCIQNILKFCQQFPLIDVEKEVFWSVVQEAAG